MGLVGVLIRRELNEFHNLDGSVEGSHGVVELGKAGGNMQTMKANSSIICPELRELDSDRVDVNGGSGCRF